MKTLLWAASCAVLGGILIACLWPFHSPRNHVSWLSGGGVEIGLPGTLRSAAEFPVPGPTEQACTIELWLRPARASDSNTLLSFYGAAGNLSLLQSQSELEIRRGSRGGKARMFTGNLFAERRPMFLAISSGAAGTAVYVDGVLVRSSARFRIPAAACAGRLIVATAPTENAPWTGELRGLAVYHEGLTEETIRRHYREWSGGGTPHVGPEERCIGLFLFHEGQGRIAHNAAAGPSLVIPERYQIERQTLLQPFWSGFNLVDIVQNIIGFIPLGFLVSASLSAGSPGRSAKVVLFGATVSVAVEVLQSTLPTRQSDSTDILTNTLGTWLGVLLYGRFSAELLALIRGVLSFGTKFRIIGKCPPPNR